jgi:DNA-binding HxlR family transcriptional regulator
MRASKSRDQIRLCPAIAFGRIVGGKYKLRILWTLRERAHRYGQLRLALVESGLGGPVTPRILSRELKEMQQRGLIFRTQFDGAPLRVEYQLTEAGTTLLPVIAAIVEWGLTGVHEEILGLPGDNTSAALDQIER